MENRYCNLLKEKEDLKYKKFTEKLVPTIDKEMIIGVRMPEIRKLAKELCSQNDSYIDTFLNDLPHRYHEENILHECIISSIDDYDRLISETEKFVPYIDNWQTSDSFYPKLFKKNPQLMIKYAFKNLKSDNIYEVRLGIVFLMRVIKTEFYSRDQVKKVISVKSGDYYLDMAVAWYMSMLYINGRKDECLYFLENDLLPVWTHNKSIQKIIESRRMDEKEKEKLKKLKKI